MLDATKLETGLLAHNFFPRVAKRGDEIPPCFVSTGFTPRLAGQLRQLPNRPGGHGAIAARTARYDLAPRNLEIIHPRAFSKIAHELKSSWKKWETVTSNRSSAIQVREHPDGRVFSMAARIGTETLMRPGGRFLAKVDITNFYGSLYTHSLPWAIHGVPAAKTNKGNNSYWGNSLDSALQTARRGETAGIATGPGTSSVVGEILLSCIDERLRLQNFEFLRYIDDYYYVAASRDEAERFVHTVRDELAILKLAIHPGKTAITELPAPIEPGWKRDLRATHRGPTTAAQLLDTIDRSLEGLMNHEDGALPYALVTIEKSLAAPGIGDDVRALVADRLLSIGFLRPIATGAACRLLLRLGSEAVGAQTDALNLILQEHATTRRTDGATWALYTLLKSEEPITDEVAETITKSGDGLTLALLACAPEHEERVINFLQSLENEVPPNYRRDEYWLLYYQFALNPKINRIAPAGYYKELSPLLGAGVSFIDLDAENPYTTSPNGDPGITGPLATGPKPYDE